MNDAVKGNWLVNASASITFWEDASSLALGVVLEINVVEHAASLRPKNDPKHINSAELVVVLRSLNLVLK